MVTREIAIANAISAWGSFNSYYASSQDERESNDAEMIESLRALGVTDDELTGAGVDLDSTRR